MNDNATASTNLSNFRLRRLEVGLSQESLAREAGCSTSTVRLAERGWLPSVQMLSRLAAALDCKPAEITGVSPSSADAAVLIERGGKMQSAGGRSHGLTVDRSGSVDTPRNEERPAGKPGAQTAVQGRHDQS